jgi:hypothetical protein
VTVISKNSAKIGVDKIAILNLKAIATALKSKSRKQLIKAVIAPKVVKLPIGFYVCRD